MSETKKYTAVREPEWSPANRLVIGLQEENHLTDGQMTGGKSDSRNIPFKKIIYGSIYFNSVSFLNPNSGVFKRWL
jgi:hypothetical protein